MDITKLSRKEYRKQVATWKYNNTLDRRLANTATSRGHLHRVGASARPSRGMSSHAGIRWAKRQIEEVKRKESAEVVHEK